MWSPVSETTSEPVGQNHCDFSKKQTKKKTPQQFSGGHLPETSGQGKHNLQEFRGLEIENCSFA